MNASQPRDAAEVHFFCTHHAKKKILLIFFNRISKLTAGILFMHPNWQGTLMPARGSRAMQWIANQSNETCCMRYPQAIASLRAMN